MKQKTLSMTTLAIINNIITFISLIIVTAVTILGYTTAPERFKTEYLIISFMVSSSAVMLIASSINTYLIGVYNRQLIKEANDFAETLFRKRITDRETVSSLVKQLDDYKK